jgi:hypothetical protein
MINMLMGDGGRTEKAVNATVGKKITSVTLENDVIIIGVEDGTKISVRDDGQSCCESRFITTDADLPSYRGKTIRGYELRQMPDGDDGYECHDQQAFVILTDEGNIDFVTHNQHNGYYGGFSVTAHQIAGPEDEE